MIPSPGSSYLLEGLTELRATLRLAGLLEDMLKVRDEELAGERRRASSRGVSSTGTSIIAELGCVTLPAHMDVGANLDAP